MEPSYRIVPLLTRSSIKPGETIEIKMFISGSGPIERNKLHLTHGYTHLLDSDNPGYWVHSLAATEQKDGELEPKLVPPGHDLKRRKLDDTGSYTHLNPIHFHDTEELEKVEAEGDIEGVDGLPGIFAERAVVNEDGESEPPLKIEYITRKDAKPGDYDINLVFTYEGSDKTFQDEKTVTVHVEGWVERNRRWLEGIAAVGALITVISIAYPVVISILS